VAVADRNGPRWSFANGVPGEYVDCRSSLPKPGVANSAFRKSGGRHEGGCCDIDGFGKLHAGPWNGKDWEFGLGAADPSTNVNKPAWHRNGWRRSTTQVTRTSIDSVARASAPRAVTGEDGPAPAVEAESTPSGCPVRRARAVGPGRSKGPNTHEDYIGQDPSSCDRSCPRRGSVRRRAVVFLGASRCWSRSAPTKGWTGLGEKNPLSWGGVRGLIEELGAPAQSARIHGTHRRLWPPNVGGPKLSGNGLAVGAPRQPALHDVRGKALGLSVRRAGMGGRLP